MATLDDIREQLTLIVDALSKAILKARELDAGLGGQASSVQKAIAELEDRRQQVLDLDVDTTSTSADLAMTLQTLTRAWKKIEEVTAAVSGEPSVVALTASVRMQVTDILEVMAKIGGGADSTAEVRDHTTSRRASDRSNRRMNVSDRITVEGADIAEEADAEPPRRQHAAEFLFATDRVKEPGNDAEPFGFERSPSLTLGAARVNVPDDDRHKLGRLELPEFQLFGFTLYRAELDPRKHFIVESIDVLDRRKFIEVAKANGTRSALVFVHGFNTTFNQAALRFAQIIWDMQYAGVPVLYSWPSRGGIRYYNYDKESTLTSRPRFIELLQLLQSDAGIGEIHILAHSMGNMIVGDALHNAAPGFTATAIAEVMLAAPDVPQSAFSDWIPSLGKIARGVTLYASSEDKALQASRGANAGPRAGDVSADGPMVFPGVDSIDVSAIGAELFGLNHNVFASNRSLIDDIGRLVNSGLRPVNKRTPQIRGVPDGVVPPRYWRYPR